MCPALDQLGKLKGSRRAHMGNSSQPACHWLLILARRKLVLAVNWELSRNFSGVPFFSPMSSPLGLFSFHTIDSCVTRVSVPRDYSRNRTSLFNLNSRILEQQFLTCGWDILHSWNLHMIHNTSNKLLQNKVMVGATTTRKTVLKCWQGWQC